MKFWLYILFLFFGPSLILYSVEFIKAYINAKNEINNKIALSEKLKNGEEIDEFDKMILNEQIKKANLINDLNRRNMKYDMGIYNIFGTEDEKNIKSVLNKIIFFNTEKEYFNYILVKGSKTHLNMEVEDIIIIQQLLIELARISKLEVPWLYDANEFIKKVDESRYWADDQKNKLLFGYRPSEVTKTAYSNYRQKLNIYKTKAMNNLIADEEYDQLLKSFFDLIVHL